MGGTMAASGGGTITHFSIGLLTGTIRAANDSHSGSGSVSGGSFGSVGSTGSVTGTALTGLSVTQNMAGTVSGTTIASFSVTGAVSGTVNVSGTLSNASFGSLAGTGTVSAGTLSSLNIGGPILGNLSAATVGKLQGTDITANGNTVLKITQGGVSRSILAVGTTSGSGTPVGVKFNFIYDGTSGVNPQAAIRVTNNSSASSADDVPFDLELVSNSAREFDLARVDGNGTSGVRNIVVQGNVLSTITPDTATFLGLSVDAHGGVQLPSDNINGVFAADNMGAGTIQANSLQGVAFGSVTQGGVKTTAASAGDNTANAVLAPGTRLIQANSTYIIPFSASQKVAFFAISKGDKGVNGNQGGFTDSAALFTDQGTDGLSVTAAVAMSAPSGTNQLSTIQTINLYGNGGSIQTTLPIQSEINSSGPLGDLILGASQGITAHVTAPSIFGNIDATSGPISATIETLSGDLGKAITDPTGKITGVTYIHSNGNMSGTIKGRRNLISSILIDGGMSGVIATQGDLGAIQRDPSANAVVQNDTAHSLTRFGGITFNGGMAGQVVALGNIFGDITVNGGLSGQIASKGQAVSGLDVRRIGFLGNITINGGIASTGTIVSVGVIGDTGVYPATGSTSYGTHLVINGNDSGLLAAEVNINFGKTGKLNTAVFGNASGDSKTAIDNIFIQSGKILAFDTVVSGKSGLSWILGDMISLHVGSNGTLTGPTG
jgi:hypothetical protein